MLGPIVTTAGLSLLLYVTGLFAFFTPLPFVFSALRRGLRPALASFLLSLLILLVIYLAPGGGSPEGPLSFLPLAALWVKFGIRPVAVLSAINFFYYGWFGISIAYLARRSFSMEKSLGLLIASSLVLPAMFLGGFAGGFGIPLIAEFRGGVQFLMERVLELQQKSGLEGDEILLLKGHIPTLAGQVVALFPSLCILLTMGIASLNTLFTRRWLSSERPFPGWGEFALWKLREKWVWLPISCGGLYFMNQYLVRSPLLGGLLLNLLLVLGGVYFFQGLAIVVFFFRRRFPPLLRMLAYLLVLLFLQVIGLVIMAIGLFDFWFDFRKLKRVA